MHTGERERRQTLEADGNYCFRGAGQGQIEKDGG